MKLTARFGLWSVIVSGAVGGVACADGGSDGAGKPSGEAGETSGGDSGSGGMAGSNEGGDMSSSVGGTSTPIAPVGDTGFGGDSGDELQGGAVVTAGGRINYGGSGGMGGSGGAGGSGGVGGSGGAGGSAGSGGIVFEKLVELPLTGAQAAMNPVSGAVWVAARFTGQLTLGTTTMTAAAVGSWVLAEIDATGAVARAYKVLDVAGGGPDDTCPTPTSIAVDESGDVYIAGNGLFGDATRPTQGGTTSVDFHGVIASGDLAEEVVVLKVEAATGATAWAFSFPLNLPQSGNSDVYLAVQNGRVGLAARLELPSVDASFLGSGPAGSGTLSGEPDGNPGYFVVGAFAAGSGAFQWAKSFGASEGVTDQQRAGCVAVDADGNVVVAGGHEATINFNPGDEANALTLEPSTSYNGFVAKLDGASGNHLYSRSLAGSDVYFGELIDHCSVARGSTELVVTGVFDDTIDLGGVVVSGGYAGFVAKFDANGAPIYSRTVPALTTRVVADAQGNFLVASGNYDYGSGPLAGLVAAWHGPSGTLTVAQSLQATLPTTWAPFVGDGRLAVIGRTNTGFTLYGSAR